MGFAESYLKKNQFTKLKYHRVPKISGLLRYIVIIPAFSEPDIYHTLESIRHCRQPNGSVEVYILVNYSESISEDIKRKNDKLFKDLKDWCSTNQLDWLAFHPFISQNLPKKHAGAGLARKILMDAAAERFSSINQPNGIIFSLDADTVVPANYFTELEKQQENNPKTNCYIFNFQHPIDGNEYSKKVYKAALQYELHLRYYKQILESTRFPFYLYTVGSCFAINTFTYIKVGGMSKRKAGEDFYFLQKVFAFTNSEFLKNINLIPSSRPSWRVPFGTGPAIRNMISSENPEYLTYHPQLFEGISTLVSIVPKLFSDNFSNIDSFLTLLPEYLATFLNENKITERLTEIRQNSSSEESFTKRFFNWFDGFLVIKYLNYASEKYLPNIEITKAVNIYINKDGDFKKSASELLSILRKRDAL